MPRAWFAAVSGCVLALAAAGAAAQVAYDAAFVTQSVPSFIQLFTPTPVSVTMKNTGTATWYQAQGDVFLATQEPQDNFYWCIQDNRYGSISGNRVLLPNDVAPNQVVTFNFVVKPLGCRFAAPAPFRFRMLSPTYGTFGEETPGAQIVISNGALFDSQRVPAIVPAGASIQVSVSFQNVTPATWQPSDGYVLAPAVMGDMTWGVTSVPLPTSVAPLDDATFDFQVTTPATPGNYNFQWQINLPEGTPFGLISPPTLVQVVAAGPPNYQGLWWNSPAASESGWGLNLAHQGDTIFATWFTYDVTGKPWWLAMTASKTSLPTATTNVYRGTLLRAIGPPFDSPRFNPALVHSFPVGTASLSFDVADPNNGVFSYTVNGVSQTKNITREVFGPLPTCTFNLLQDLTKAYTYQDLWWASPAGVEAGWGINLTQQGDTIFATWFTYAGDGTPLWLAAIAPKTDLDVYGGTLYTATGPPFSAVPFNPSQVVSTAVGTATFTFTDGNNGSFEYTVNGETQSKAITRQVFVTPGTVCQ
jgi:hypothetical protein